MGEVRCTVALHGSQQCLKLISNAGSVVIRGQVFSKLRTLVFFSIHGEPEDMINVRAG